MNSDYIEYIVKKGDSLYDIAKQYKTTIAELLDVNMLTSNIIYPNQVLLVPLNNECNKCKNEYVVKRNDTMEKISNTTGIDIELLGAYNDFGKLILQENQTLVIPRNERCYVVLENDTPRSISEKTGRSYEELLALNIHPDLRLNV